MANAPVRPVVLSAQHNWAIAREHGSASPRSMSVKQLLRRLLRDEQGVLSFEWTVLTSLLTVGVVSGVASVRDAVIDEMGDVAQAMVALDQSYLIQPPLA